MAIDPDQIRALVEQPVEALQVELKTWLDPRTDDGIAKLVKAMFAIRNRNGGFLLIGFDNGTMAPASNYPHLAARLIPFDSWRLPEENCP